MIIALAAITLLLWLLTFIRAMVAVAKTPRVQIQEPSGDLRPAVAVFVPVRDEMDQLPRTLPSLLQQQGVDLELIIYNDFSSDGSAAYLEQMAQQDSRIRVVHGQSQPPPGWCGKPFALENAVAAYSGAAQLWLFLDADVELDSRAVLSLVHELQTHRVNLVSALPTLACKTFWSAVLGPNFAAVATLPYPPSKVNDARDPTAFMNGQIVLMQRQTYVESGGFAAVKEKVLEDVALARRIKQQGGALRIVDGQAIAKTQMYKGLAEHVGGWRKNIFALVGSSQPRALFLALFMTTMAYLPVVCAVQALLYLAAAMYLKAGLLALAYLVPTALQITIRARAKAAPLFAPLAPLAATIVSATLLVAAFSRRKVTWKGRQYDA